MKRIVLIGILLVTLVVPATAQVPPVFKMIPSGTRVGTKAVLVISIGRAKAARLPEHELAALVRKLAKEIRAMDGVRSIEAVWFAEWRDAARTRVPWTPYGVVVVVENRNPDRLARLVDAIWQAASQIDQEMVRFNALDDW